jgi:hypothetical protein
MTAVNVVSPVHRPPLAIIPMTTSWVAVVWLRNVRRNYDAVVRKNEIMSDTTQPTLYVSCYFLKKSSLILSVLVLHVIAKDAQVCRNMKQDTLNSPVLLFAASYYIKVELDDRSVSWSIIYCVV